MTGALPPLCLVPSGADRQDADSTERGHRIDSPGESLAARTELNHLARDERRSLIKVWTERNQDLPSKGDGRFHSGLHDGLLIVHDLRGIRNSRG